jgi:hypothetical protein
MGPYRDIELIPWSTSDQYLILDENGGYVQAGLSNAHS